MAKESQSSVTTNDADSGLRSKSGRGASAEHLTFFSDQALTRIQFSEFEGELSNQHEVELSPVANGPTGICVARGDFYIRFDSERKRTQLILPIIPHRENGTGILEAKTLTIAVSTGQTTEQSVFFCSSQVDLQDAGATIDIGCIDCD